MKRLLAGICLCVLGFAPAALAGDRSIGDATCEATNADIEGKMNYGRYVADSCGLVDSISFCTRIAGLADSVSYAVYTWGSSGEPGGIVEGTGNYSQGVHLLAAYYTYPTDAISGNQWGAGYGRILKDSGYALTIVAYECGTGCTASGRVNTGTSSPYMYATSNGGQWTGNFAWPAESPATSTGEPFATWALSGVVYYHTAACPTTSTQSARRHKQQTGEIEERGGDRAILVDASGYIDVAAADLDSVMIARGLK